ncbi:MAG: VWA domain-containing protein [Thauera sp.]
MNRPASGVETPPAPRLFEALEAPLAPLDRLPRSLWLGVLTHAGGELVPRLQALETWRAALLRGELPAPTPGWPVSMCAGVLEAAADSSPEGLPRVTLDGELRAVFVALKLPAYCVGREELADTMLQGLLFHLDLIVDYCDRGASPREAEAMAVAAFADDWGERCGEMDELIGAFGDLGDLLKNARWDALRGLLRSSEWREVVRIRALIERLPELVRIIRALGRNVPSADDAALSHALRAEPAPAQSERTVARRVRVPDMPGETRGVHRSGRVARMLPAEAMLLGHPQLRRVWHARHAERTLLAYEDDDQLQALRRERASVLRPDVRPAPGRRLEAGPMLVCVDTSGSMQGGAEAVAKAVVLEAVRCAHAQGRACHVFAFGGPDEVVEMPLGVDLEGVHRLTRFLGQSFGGGTDICAPLERALARLEDAEWQRADLLIASDGEFGATPALAERLHTARGVRGLRVQGILIGDRETIGLLELADDIHWVRDWRRYGRAGEGTPARGEGLEAGGSPVHSRSLTATYFPGALRNAENRARTLSPEAAAAAVRAGRHRGDLP